MDGRLVILPYCPRPQLSALHDSLTRFKCLVAHRRCGKTVFCINHLIRAAVEHQRKQPPGRFGYISPYFKQSKAIAWDYLHYYAGPIPGVKFNETDLRCDFPNGSQIRLFGADNFDAMRGIYLDGIVLDEFGDMDPRAWRQVIRPALSDYKGWAIFIGTPRGRNEFATIYDRAQTEPDWERGMFRASETQIVPAAELASARREMSEEEYAAEYECSFDAPVVGSYYGKLLAAADAEKRIGRVMHDPMLPVSTFWDLGIGDSTAIWFAQQVATEIRIIDYYEMSGEGMAHYAKVIQAKSYNYHEHVGPHDAAARLQDEHGRTRVEILASLGIRMRVLAQSDIDDGINAARVIIPRCWFDAEKCGRGLEALRQYRREFDEKNKVFKNRPLHDWASHAADAFRYLAVGIKPISTAQPRKVQSRGRDGWLG